ncbi:MAG: hypothetical protein R6X21_09245 [Candidatus Aminicenantes bacterium]
MAGVYRPRHPERTVLYRVLFHHFDRFLTEYESRFEREYGFFRPVVKEVVEKYLDWIVFTIPKRLRVFFKFDRRLLEIQKKLPPAERIRVISLSIGWDPKERGYEQVRAAVERVKKEGLFVVSSSLAPTYDEKFRFHGLGRDPLADPDLAASYGPGSWWEDQFHSLGGGLSKSVETLLIPMDSRTVAGFTGLEDYTFYRNGGWSWSIPYIAGLYALACQVEPEMTPERFWTKALETGGSITMPAREKAARSPEEIERMLQKNFLEPLAQLKARTKSEDLEKAIAEGYNRMTGNKLEKMSEAEIRKSQKALRSVALIRKVYKVDPLVCTDSEASIRTAKRCSRCGGRMKIIAILTHYSVVDRIIDYRKLTLAAEKPPPVGKGNSYLLDRAVYLPTGS